MSKFKFFHGNQIPDNQIPDNQIPDNQIPDNQIPDNQIPDNQINRNRTRGPFRSRQTKYVTVTFEVRVTAAQGFAVPIDYDLDGLSASEAYNRLMNEFSSQNFSILEDPTTGIDDCTDVEFSHFKSFRQNYYNENGILTAGLLEIE
jgi:hypothetical protein